MLPEKVVRVRPATAPDIRAIQELIQPFVNERILLGKEAVALYEALPEFLVAEHEGEVVGCGALHVMWEHLGEVRTLCVKKEMAGMGIGHLLLEALEKKAWEYKLTHLFCLTFETEFFQKHGFRAIPEDESIVAEEVYSQLLRSTDEGVAEFLDLARVKPNTLGNTRMLKIFGQESAP